MLVDPTKPDPAGGQTTYDAKSRPVWNLCIASPADDTGRSGVATRIQISVEGILYDSDNSHGVNNEITEETARITVKKGILIMIESKD